MKLTNLSLAIMVAVGVAACGGSDDDNSNKPADPPKPNQPQTDNNNNNKPTPPAESPKVVDPTGTHVVDNKDLTKENTVGTLQYIRRDGSQYDRANNPSKPASASPLLGVTLNDQNPKLTNIVFARQNLQREDGKAVKAQFGGMDNPEPLDENGNVNYDSLRAGQPDNGRSLQEENFANVDILAPYKRVNGNVAGTHFNADNVLRGADATRVGLYADTGVVYSAVETTAGANKGTRIATIPVAGTNNVTAIFGASNEKKVYNKGSAANPEYVFYDKKNGLDGGATGDEALNWTGYNAPDSEAGASAAVAGTITTGRTPTFSKVDRNKKAYAVYQTERQDSTIVPKTVAGTKLFWVKKADDKFHTVTANEVNTLNASADSTEKATATRLGYGLVWWSAPVTTYENSFTRMDDNTHSDFTVASRDANGDSTVTAEENAAFERNGGAATTGLIRVGGGLETLGEELTYNSTTKKWEDHHQTTSRIFGRYHLATAVEKDGKKSVKQVDYNTFNGARAFTAEYKDGDTSKKATQYSIGAIPSTLQYVQYGRVSNQLDLDAGKEGYPDGFVRNYFQRKGTDDSVDNYFYRGTNATTIEQMAALPSNQIAVYNGHALMYGIDNSYHNYTKTADGKKQPLPNAFAPSGSAAAKPEGLGLGNFVTVAANFGTKRVSGEVYNQWLLDPSKAELTPNTLVQFAGDIVGNTVVGVADRTYVDGRDDATFKASFFGEQAQEIGGSFNSVKDNDKYASAYGTDDWGGVFGATKGASNTFQGDDGANVYGGATQRQ